MPSVGGFTFNCGTATTTGTFTANGTAGQTGTLVVPMTGATAGTVTLNVTGTGFTGTLTTTLTAGQTSVTIPITYDGTGISGSRTLTVTSTAGVGTCTKAVTVVCPTIAAATATTVQPTCTVATGTITVTSPSSGVTYSFDNGATYQASATSNALIAGTYQVITQNTTTNCTSTALSETINAQPVTPSVPTLTVTQPTCSISTGTITVNTPTGMTYSIDGVDYTNTTGIFSSLAPNAYTVTAKSSGGCVSPSASATINPAISTPVLSITQPTCSTPTGSSLVQSPTGAGITYSIDGVDYSNTTGIFSNLPIGTYTITAKNDMGCLSVGTTFSIIPPVPAPTLSLIQPTCAVATGSITVTAPTTDVEYSFDNGLTYQVSPTKSGLGDGLYQVVVNNTVLGCASSATVATINVAPAHPVQPTTTVTQPTCTVATGVILVTNPTSGVTYSFDNGATYQASATSNSMASGVYQVLVKDDVNGCESTVNTTTIDPQPTTPSVPVTTTTQPTCAVATGVISVTNPTSGVTYSFDNGATYQASATSNALPSGTYQVVVKANAGGCVSAATATTIDPQPITPATPTFTFVAATCANTTGSITISAPLAAGMTYSVNGSDYSNTTGAFTGLGLGLHVVSAKSSAGCISPSVSVTFTPWMSFDIKVLLEGAYQTITGLMQTTLNQRGLLPGQTPIGQFAIPTPQGQPFKGLPWNYAGTEGDTVTTYPTTVVDWVLISLRTDSTSSTNAFRMAGWLHSDGHVSFITPCFNIPNGSYFVLVEHRNHVGVLSPTKLTAINSLITQDFTTNDSYIRTNPPSTGQKLKGGKWVMLSGDGKKDTPTTNYDVNFNDAQLWKIQSGIFDQYLYGDHNMDADINFSDSFLWKLNSGKYSGVPHW
jgi:hypothetical protein